MSLLAFLMELYFAIVLGVSGLAKINNPRHFAATLRQQKILPSWSIKFACVVFPYMEIVIALLLITGVATIIGAIIALTIFTVFLGVKIFLFATGNTEDCGCYGNAHPQPIDIPSIVVSALFVLLAVAHLWLVIYVTSVAWIWRLISVIVLAGIGFFLIRKSILPTSTDIIYHNDIGGLDIGEKAPPFTAVDQYDKKINLEDFQGQKRLLAFVLPGCPSCPGAIEALKDLNTREQPLITLIIGAPDIELNRSYAAEYKVHAPFLTPDPNLVEQKYKIWGFPLVLAIDEKGVVRAKGVVNQSEHLCELLNRAYAA